MEKSKQIKIGALISYFSIFFGIATGLIYTPWMMKEIGQSSYGLYTLAMSLINTFMIDFGLSMAAQRYITKYLAENDQKSVNDITGLIYKLYFAITLIILAILLVLYFFIENIYTQLTADEIEVFKGLYIIAMIYSVISFPFIPLNGMLSAYEKFIQLKLSDFVHKILGIILTIGALIAGLGVYSLVLVNLIAGILFIIVRLVMIKKSTPIKPNFNYSDLPILKELFAFSIWTSISTMVFRFLLSLAPSILGIVSPNGTDDIAVFGYAVSLESYIYMFVTAINGFFLPKLSRISVKNNAERSSEETLKLMVIVGRFILLLFILIFVGFFALGKDFINLIFGSEYEKSYYCTLLICAYGIIAYPQQIANTYVMVKNKVRARAFISLISFAVDIALSFVLGSFMGAVGVSIAICIALFLHTLMMNVLYHKSLKLNMLRFFKQCHLKLLPGILIFVAASLAITLIPLSGWLGFILKVLCILVAFVVIVWFIIFKGNRKNFFTYKD